MPATIAMHDDNRAGAQLVCVRQSISISGRLTLSPEIRPRFGARVTVIPLPETGNVPAHLWLLPWHTAKAGQRLLRQRAALCTESGIILGAIARARDVPIDDHRRIVLPRPLLNDLDFGCDAYVVYWLMAFTARIRRNWNDGVLGVRVFATDVSVT